MKSKKRKQVVFEVVDPVLKTLSDILQRDLDSSTFETAYNLFALVNYYPLMSDTQIEQVLKDVQDFSRYLRDFKDFELGKSLWTSLKNYRDFLKRNLEEY